MGKTPNELAQTLMQDTLLADIGERERLIAGGEKAISESHDAMISFARDRVEGIARSIKARYETVAAGAVFRERWRVNRIRESIYSDHPYPDATASPRLSFGRVQGLGDVGSGVPALSSISSIFESPSDSRPALPPSWLATRTDLDGTTALNFFTAADTIGGNSGSPVLDGDSRVLGVLSGGTSVGTYYDFDPDYRAYSVTTTGMLELLRKTYHAQNLLRELDQQ